MHISLRDFEIGDLNNTSIMILSKFARVLHKHDRTVLKLRDPNILLEVAKHANHTDNSELKLCYQRLKLELRKQLNTAIPHHENIGRLAMQDNLLARVQRRSEARRAKHQR